MKKIMWFAAMLPAIVTSVVFKFLPDQLPMHHDLAGNTDRWGNKAESFIFPILILFMALFWQMMIYAFEKKEGKAATEKEQMEAKANAKILSIVGILQTIMFDIMHFGILYSSCMQAAAESEKSDLDIAKLSCVLCGIMFIVIGNYMTKSKNNSIVGVRTGWSQYNDNTWRKSNRAGAVSLMIAGLLTVITTVFVNGMTSMIWLLVYLLVGVIVTVIYSKKVYD